VKTTLILACILLQRLTTADPNFAPLSKLADSIGWYQLSGTRAWSAGDGDIDDQKHARCDGRQVHTIRRYQFGGERQLVKTTEHDYCGSAPRSAFQ
jgi:hypothetical protein